MVLTTRVYFHTVIILLYVQQSHFWELDHFGINNDYYASSIAIFKNRAFLTLPRSSCYNKITYPTVIEVSWSGGRSVRVRRPIEFPPTIIQNWGECEQIQDGVFLAVQEAEGRLWVLDAGSILCNPKIVIYDLNFDVEFQKFQLVGVPKGTLTSLVIDSRLEDDLIYVGSKEKNTLIVISLEESLWWQLNLNEKVENNVFTTILAISPIDSTLYSTNPSKEELFRMDINKEKNLTINVETKIVGNKLGPSGGMLVDLKGGLNYYLTRDYAVVRWNTDSQNLIAENHDVLAQSFRALPYVPCIFTGPQGGIWALVNPYPPVECSNSNNKTFSKPTGRDRHKLRTRIIKLLKFIKKE